MLKRVPEQWHGEEALLVVVDYLVSAAVISLVKYVFVIGNVLQVQRYFHSTVLKLPAVGYLEVGAEIIRLLH